MKKIKYRIITPDDKWEVYIREDDTYDFFDRRKITGKYTIEEIIESFRKLEQE
jgi:hypothetical protein|tara:strand:+ start:129 stop:287 length:159 start_codon:yes stop_codon:yes gene_type:complete